MDTKPLSLIDGKIFNKSVTLNGDTLDNTPLSDKAHSEENIELSTHSSKPSGAPIPLPPRTP